MIPRGTLNTRSHQKRGPVDGMKPQDVFADQVQRRPELFKADGPLAFFITVADGRDVIRERVEPDVDCVGRIIRHRNAPTHRTSQPANREVLQATANKAHYFVAPRFGANEVGPCFVQLEQSIAVV